MTEVAAGQLSRTVLHDWHLGHGARMVDFAGWEMPVQYPTGTIAEHLATRRSSGIFDICHMGRFRIRGPHAEEHLGYVLTNDPRGLRVGEAHYTFIANEGGGAVDDAYLYRIGGDDYLLVVNAANREKDWEWLVGHNHQGAELADVGEELGMISAQGPAATEVLLQALGDIALPENKRNRLTVAEVGGRPLVIARTGYTGEPIGFEMFPERRATVELWERLVAAGALPSGLGARDSLRLEAGFPLYGHELGEDPEGREIPIFANSLAAWAVRASASSPFIGQEDLARQRAEFMAIRRGELSTPVDERRLTHLVQPIAVFQGRRPLRPGYGAFHHDQHVGYVTSGTTVPYTDFDGRGIDARPIEEHSLRPIGLALVRSDIRYRSDVPVVLRIVDGQGRAVDAELVEKNLWSTAPFARPYRGFEPMPAPPRLEAESPRALAARLKEESEANTRWRREECINLIPSEQSTSRFVDGLCRADPAGRYNEHNRIRALGPNAEEVRYYQGTGFIMEKEEELKSALRELFGCTQVEARPISGQMANSVVYDALKQFRNRFLARSSPHLIERALVHDLNKGGHLSAQVGGALKNYLAIDPRTERPAVEHFPLHPGHPYTVDVEATKELIADTDPKLVVFGRSVMLQAEPVADIAEFVHSHYGRENPQRPIIMYDAAHVLGLLGPHFQDPLAQGADVVTGSTHKTFFGPQRGVILSNIEPGSVFESLWRQVERRAFPGHVSNHHLGTLLGLLGATYEMLEFRHEYPPQVISNAKAFAAALAGEGLSVEGDPDIGFTETHQTLLRGARAQGAFLADLLERNNIITNSQALHDDPSFAAASGVRMGTQEMTRYGMREPDFAELAALLAEIIRESREHAEGHWREKVIALRSRFRQMKYCL